MLPDSRPRQAWALAAHKTRQEISALQRGNRELGLKALANKTNLNPQTLRRRVSALDFLARFEKETEIPSALLESYPIAAIEFLARWHSHDPNEAWNAAIELIEGQIDIQQLGEKEKKSRTSAFAGTGKALELDYKSEIETAIQSFFKAPLIRVDKVARHPKNDPTSLVDFTSQDTYPGPKTGIIIVGPYRDPELYERRAFDWIAKASALLKVFDVMCLILPSNAQVNDFSGWWEPLEISPHQLALLTVIPFGQIWPHDSHINELLNLPKADKNK
jgi:hypothetical protein